jgi:hypothetical protein
LTVSIEPIVAPLSVVLLSVVLLLLLAWIVCKPLPRVSWWRHETPLTLEERQAARVRADDLLRGVIGEESFQGLQQRRFLEIQSPSVRNRVYRIPNGRGLVKVYEDARFVMSLCVAPTTALPAGDLVLMHKLMIEANEDHYLSVANRMDFVRQRGSDAFDIFR